MRPVGWEAVTIATRHGDREQGFASNDLSLERESKKSVTAFEVCGVVCPYTTTTHALTMPEILSETDGRLLTKDSCAIAFRDRQPRSAGIGSIMHAADINITNTAWSAAERWRFLRSGLRLFGVLSIHSV